MNIGEASKASGVTQKMIRYYESIGLLGKVRRESNSYRVYGENDVHTLAFIRRARNLGFSMEKIQHLMTLWRDKERSSGEVKAIAEEHISGLAAKIDELEAMRRTLEHLVSSCHGDQRPDCPIIENLATRPAAPSGKANGTKRALR